MKNISIRSLCRIAFHLLVDMLILPISILAATMLKFESDFTSHLGAFWLSIPAIVAIYIILYIAFGLYKVIWRFARTADVVKYSSIVILSVLLSFVVNRLVIGDEISVFVYIAGCFIAVCAIMCVKIADRILSAVINIQRAKADHHKQTITGNIMVIGGGSAGTLIIRDIESNENTHAARVRCVIDDDDYKSNRQIYGIPVVGGRDYIEEAVKKYSIDLIIFAIPTCPQKERKEILEICAKTNCKTRVICRMDELINKDIPTLSDTHEIQIEDLLGRDPVKIDLDSVAGYVSDKVVMVTGAGGSIGSELCRQIAAHSPKKLILFDIYENTTYDILNELKRTWGEKLDLVSLIGSVRDERRLDAVFAKYRPELVFHAAAHKHVPLMEDSPNESIKNNVFGTYNMTRMADKYGVKRFLLISTDKAVNPTNIMGASKRICEMIVQSMSRKSKTEFVAVRFGNVLGSNGSVIPLFKKQIAEGGPVTVTDPNIIRFFMTIPEAVSLVLSAGAFAHGGEIFVLDMGEPVKILTLAENLIRLSGFVPYEEIPITFTGLRPGEKLYEELLMNEEGLKRTNNRLIFIGKPIDIDDDHLYNILDRLKDALYNESVDIRPIVGELVPTYNYEGKKNA